MTLVGKTRLRFRAWDGQRMRAGVSVDPYGWYKNEDSGKLADVMQFTGLKDRNSIEIYEGDIVTKWETRRWNASRAEKSYRFPSYRRVVKWHTSTQRNGWNIYKGNVRSFEVVGNIYENKDLLK